MWQGVNSIGHFLKKSIFLARNDIKFWNLACNLGYVFTKQGTKKKFISYLKICFIMFNILLCQDKIFYHFWLISYEWNFCIVNIRQSSSNFWCFFRDHIGTKMTYHWKGMTIFLWFYRSRYEVWHKCDRENRLFWLYFWLLNPWKSRVWRMHVENFVPRDVLEQVSSSTEW